MLPPYKHVATQARAGQTLKPSHFETISEGDALLLMSPVRTECDRMRRSFCILIVLGDLLDGGELQFVEAVQTSEDARQRIEALAALLPGQYVIYNKETGQRLSVTAGVEG